MLVFPVIRTERLILRKLEPEDFESLVRYADNKAVSDNILNIPHPFREPDAAMRLSSAVQGFKNKSRFVFAIEFTPKKEVVGEIAIHLADTEQKHAQLAYWIGEPYWNQGIVTEAVKAILDFGFNRLEQALIYADCYAENLGSSRVLIKNGMNYHTSNGNIQLFRITKEEYAKT